MVKIYLLEQNISAKSFYSELLSLEFPHLFQYFEKKISKNLSRPDQKFVADMLYGILASGSCLLSDISDRLSESSKKKNTIDRLSKHLQAGVPEAALNSYLTMVKSSVPSESIIHIDDSDVVKPNGQHFESLGRVRAGYSDQRQP